MASKRWRCFFCDEVFTTRRDAWLHFGDTTDLPTCVDPLREDERARMNEVRELRDEVIRQQAVAEEFSDSKDLLDSLYEELRRYFGRDCNSVWLAGDRYKSALNRISDFAPAPAASKPEAGIAGDTMRETNRG